MTDRRKQTGRYGEELAAAFLSDKGYRLLHRNWRCAAGELDLVVEDGDTLVFVEVRTRRSRRFGPGEESITPAKQARLITLARTYLQEHDMFERPWRIDIAAVHLTTDAFQINYIENAVGW